MTDQPQLPERFPYRVYERVVRDESGEITGYSLPGVYSPSDDLITEWELETWDESEDDADDNTKRDVADFLVLARNYMPAMLAEIARLRGEA